MHNPDHRVSLRVKWIDVDQTGTVHFASYVRFMEESEYSFLKSRGLNVVLKDSKGEIGFPRTSVDFEVLRPATVDELLTIWVKVTFNDGVKIRYAFEVCGEDHQLVARGNFEVACCRFVGGQLPKAILIPDQVLERIPEIKN